MGKASKIMLWHEGVGRDCSDSEWNWQKTLVFVYLSWWRSFMQLTFHSRNDVAVYNFIFGCIQKNAVWKYFFDDAWPQQSALPWWNSCCRLHNWKSSATKRWSICYYGKKADWVWSGVEELTGRLNLAWTGDLIFRYKLDLLLNAWKYFRYRNF